MKKLLLTVALGITVASWSQAKTISGLVKDKKTGDPMIGAVIQVKDNKSLATTTGLDGTFALKDLPETGRVTLVVTYMSYKTKEVTVDLGKAENLNVNLEEDAKQLGEVVVHGVRNNRTDRSAITMEKNAGQVLNVMSQQALQLSPDVNVASAL